MRLDLPRWWVLLAATSSAFISCQDSQDSQDSQGKDNPAANVACRRVSLGAFAADDHYSVGAPVANSTQFLYVELDKESTHGAGTYAIGSADRNPEECSTCIGLVAMSNESDENAPATYAAEAGSVIIDDLGVGDGQMKGRLENVRLVKWQVSPDPLKNKADPSGECLLIESAPFDTFVDLSKACSSSSECGPFACDPATRRCSKQAVCEEDEDCGDSGWCIDHGAGNVAACHPRCEIDGAPCPDSMECLALPDDDDAYCVPRGTAVLGEACQRSDVSTGCVAGARCIGEGTGTVCRKACDFLGDGSDCTSDEICTPQGACQPATVLPAVEPGAACGEGASFCAISPGRVGACLRGADGAFSCRKLCFQDGNEAQQKSPGPGLSGKQFPPCEGADRCVDALYLGAKAGAMGACRPPAE